MGAFWIIWIILAIGVGYLANSRGRSGLGFFLFSLLLSPLIGFVIVLIMSNLVEEEAKERLRRRDHERHLESIRAIASAKDSNVKVEPAPKNQASISVTDELIKLAELRDKGILTEQEFQSQKAAILKLTET